MDVLKGYIKDSGFTSPLVTGRVRLLLIMTPSIWANYMWPKPMAVEAVLKELVISSPHFCPKVKL